jgi:hypothetical protein
MQNHWLHKRRWTKQFGCHLRINCLEYNNFMRGWQEDAWKQSFREMLSDESLCDRTSKDENWIDGWAGLATIVCAAWVIAYDHSLGHITFQEGPLMAVIPDCINFFKPTHPVSFTEGYRVAVKQFLIEQFREQNAP